MLSMLSQKIGRINLKIKDNQNVIYSGEGACMGLKAEKQKKTSQAGCNGKRLFAT